MEYPYQPLEENIFAVANIRNCEDYIFSIQTKLDKAVANNDTKSIRETFNLLAKGSQAAKVLAIWRITQRNAVKCIRLFRPQFRKVKIRFVVEIP